MVASSKVSSKVSYSTSTTNTAEESIDEQYSTLLHELFSFRKQDPDLFQTLMDSLHHHQGYDGKQQRRCDLETVVDDDNDDDDVIERLRIIIDEREDMDSTTTNAADNTKSNSSNKKLSKKMQAKSMIEGVPRLFDSETANIYYDAMKAKKNVPNKPANTISMIKSSKKKISWAEKKKTNMSKLELLNLQLALESIKVE